MSARNPSHGGTYRVNLRLDPEHDADLIVWLESLPNGQRSSAVREVIRRGLGMTASAEPVLDLESIRQVIADELSRSFVGLRLQNQAGHEDASLIDAESTYGVRLDRMLGGLSQGTTENPEEP